MRFLKILACVLSLAAVGSAAEFKIKVVDPQSAAIADAQVVLLQNDVPVTVMLSSWRFDSSLAVVLLLALGLGSLIAALVSTPSVIESLWTKSRLRRQIASVEQDRDRLERRLLTLELEVARLSAESDSSTTLRAHQVGSKPMPPPDDKNISMSGAKPVRAMQQALRS